MIPLGSGTGVDNPVKSRGQLKNRSIIPFPGIHDLSDGDTIMGSPIPEDRVGIFRTNSRKSMTIIFRYPHVAPLFEPDVVYDKTFDQIFA